MYSVAAATGPRNQRTVYTGRMRALEQVVAGLGCGAGFFGCTLTTPLDDLSRGTAAGGAASASSLSASTSTSTSSSTGSGGAGVAGSEGGGTGAGPPSGTIDTTFGSGG